MKTSWRRLKDVFRLRRQKTSSIRLQDVLIKTNMFALDLRLQKTSWSRPIYSSWPYVFKTSCQDVFKKFWSRLQDIFKTSSRRLQNVFKTSCKNIFKKSSRCLPDILQRYLQDVFSVSSSKTVLVSTSLRSIQHVCETFFSKEGYLQRNLPFA